MSEESNAADGTGQPAIELYYSYAANSTKDAALFETLEEYIKQLERQGLVTCWHPGLLTGGKEPGQESEHHFNSAQVILLLLSPAYIASNECYAEMQRAVARANAGEITVAPIVLRPVEVEALPFSRAQLLPTAGRAVTDWPSPDQACQDIVLGLRRILEQLKRSPRPTAPIQEQLSKPLTWNIPYLRNPYFTGREELLQHLHDNLTRDKTAALTQAQQPLPPQASQQAQAIHGLGGIGKTQTAIEYAYRHQDEYHSILWVNAATLDTLITSFTDLADVLKLPERAEQDQRIVVAAVNAWFVAHDGWLAIYDNADDLALVEDYLPRGGKGHLLLTTRAQAPGTLARGLGVEKMNTPEGSLLLLRRAKVLAEDAPLEQATPADRQAAEAILHELDGLPLALDQAGAYIEETQCSLASYLEQYRQRQSYFLQRRGGLGKLRHEPVATTWSLSFQKVEALNPLAAELLRCCAFLAPDAIPEPLIVNGASRLGPILAPLADDPSLLDEAIATLARYSLLKRDREEQTLSVHRLVQTILRTSLDEPAQREWAERTVRAMNEAFPDVTDYRNWPLIRLFLPHAQACVDWIDRWQFAFNEAGRLCNHVGYYLSDHARYTEAEEFYQRAIAISEKTLGPEHPTLATYLNNLANLYTNQGQYAQAEPLFQRAISIDEKTLGTEHPDLAIRLNNLANLYTKQGQYEQAEPLYQRVIAIGEKTLGSEHPTLAIRLNNLALLYSEQGQYAQAELLYRRAIKIREKVFGLDHSFTMRVRENYADFLRKRGAEGKDSMD